MKTKLPDAITSIEEAKAFLTDLYNNGESYHPEDNAHDVDWNVPHNVTVPDFAECEHLNKLMDDIYKLPGNDNIESMAFDPCEFLLHLDPDYGKDQY